jgi:ABC-type multidrug transport system ATPase subunit
MMKLGGNSSSTQYQTVAQFSFARNGAAITLGRDPSCDVPVTGANVASVHARIKLGADAVRIVSGRNKTGIKVNGRRGRTATLKDGDTVAIGGASFTVHCLEHRVVLDRHTEAPEPEEDSLPRRPASPKGSVTIRIGRGTDADIRVDHPLVSRLHCIVTRNRGGAFTIADQKSTNGTYVNGRRVAWRAITPADVVQVGPQRFTLEGERFVRADDRAGIGLEAHDLVVKKRSATLLDGVSLSIRPGEFVAILGPSGAGKTSLARALTGQLPVDSGEVYFNGLPIKGFLGAFEASIGYVSQHNLLRSELSVRETLKEQSILRLPRDSTGRERTERIEAVMDLLEIADLGRRRIRALSGGEAKRVHVGVELLSSPSLLFLDEPLAGLDPGLIHKFMELFHRLSEKGHTLLLTTHTLEKIELCAQIVFVNKGGVVYAGPPKRLTRKVGTSSIAEVYQKVRTTEFAERMAEGDHGKKETARARSGHSASYPIRPPRTIGLLRQLMVLVARNARIVLRDYRSLALVLVQAPLIALLLTLVFNADSPSLSVPFCFCLTIAAIWMGGVNSARSLAGEWPFLAREFRIGVSTRAYVTARMLVDGMLSVVQSVIFAGSLAWLFSAFPFSRQMVALIAVSTVSGMLLGLCISAFSTSVSQAVVWLPIVFIPQILFSGLLMPFDQMPSMGRWVSRATLSRPLFLMFKESALLDRNLPALSGWPALVLLDMALVALILLRVRFHPVTGRQAYR